MKLTPQQLVEWQAAANNFRITQEVIIGRINEIVHRIAKTFEKNLKTWWIDGAAEREVGNPIIENEMIYYQSEPRFQNCLIFDRDGGEWDLFESFPSRWLTEDFEEELEQGSQKYQAWRKEQSETAKCREQEKLNNERRLYEQLKKKFDSKTQKNKS